MDIKKHSAPAKPRSFLQSDCKQGQVYRLVGSENDPIYLICARIRIGLGNHLRMISLSTGNRQSDDENTPERYVPVNAVLHVED